MGCEAAQQGVAAGRITCSFSQQQCVQLLPACKEVLPVAKACTGASPPLATTYAMGLIRRRLEPGAMAPGTRRCPAHPASRVCTTPMLPLTQKDENEEVRPEA